MSINIIQIDDALPAGDFQITHGEFSQNGRPTAGSPATKTETPSSHAIEIHGIPQLQDVCFSV